MKHIKLRVSFTHPPAEMMSALWFAQMPSIGDGIETKRGGYVIKRIIHVTHEGLDVEPDIELLLEPVESF